MNDVNERYWGMDTNKLTWVKFYTEFATKLLVYKNDRKTLIAN